MPSTLESISSTTLSSSQQSITFSNIPQTYTDLRIIGIFRSSTTTSNNPEIGLYKNGDSNVSNYARTRLRNGFGGNTMAGSNPNNTTNFGNIPNANTPAGLATPFDIHIGNYTSTKRHSYFVHGSSWIADGSSDNGGFMYMSATAMVSTSAITSLTFWEPTTNTGFAAGTSVTLYGIARA
jgi:hypothetical protein